MNLITLILIPWVLQDPALFLQGVADASARVIAGGNSDRVADEIVVIEVVGEGATAAEAFDDAVRSALRQVAGSFIRSDTKVEGDRIIEDRVVAHTQGFIERATKVGPATSSAGRMTQRVRVAVRRSKVEQVVREGLGAQAPVDGGTLHARIQSLRERNASAEQLVSALFENWPACVLACDVVSEPERIAAPLDGSALGGEEVALQVKLDFSVDADRWKAWSSSAHDVLKAVSERHVVLDWSLTNAGATRVSQSTAVGERFIAFVAPTISRKAAAARHWVAQGWLFKNSHDEVHAMEKLGKLFETMRTKEVEVEDPDSLLVGATVRHSGSIVALLNEVDGKPTAYLLPTAKLVFGTAEEDAWGVSLDADIFGAPSFDARLLDSAGNSIGRRVLPLGAFDYYLMPGPAEAPGAAMMQFTSDGSLYRIVCSPAMRSESGAHVTPWGRSVLLAPALWAFRFGGPGENIVSERVTLTVGYVVKRSDVERIAKVDVRLGGRVSLSAGRQAKH